MKWVRCELPKKTAGKFKEYCRDMKYRYEPSENGNMIHFEVLMPENHITKANAFIDANC